MKKRISRFDRSFKDGHFRVALFGSARIRKGDKIYTMVHSLAQMIGHENIDIVTGGGPGLMEAATAGHAKGSKKAKNKSHSFGLRIRLPNEQHAGKHLNLKREFHRFSERLDNFMRLSNAVVVAPGGLGTLLELFYAWQLVQVKHVCPTPIILLGDHYDQLIAWIKRGPLKHKLMSKEDMESIYVVKTNDQAMEILKKARDLYLKEGKNACVNFTKYKV